MLRTQTSNQMMNDNLSEREAQCATQTLAPKAGKVLKAVVVYFLGLDASISIPLMIFIPWYVTIKMAYGAEVTKELMPLWILGSHIVAVYVKIMQGLCSLYFFLFMHARKLIKNLPRYSLLGYNYIAVGKLRAYIWVCLGKPAVHIEILEYGAYFRQKHKQLEAWALEKYLDFVESMWPHYCGTIRFLKKAYLI